MRNLALTQRPEATLPRRSLRANFLWTLAGNVAYGACQWGMLIVIAKTGTPEMVGYFALAFAVTAPVFMFANLNLRALIATDSRTDYAAGEYLGLRITLLGGAWLVVAALCAAYYRGPAAAVVGLVALAKTAESVSDVLLGVMQQNERMDAVSRSLTFKGILSLAAVAAGMLLTHDIRVSVLGLVIAWAGMLAFYDVPQAARSLPAARRSTLPPRWTKAVQLDLFRLALPLGIATLVSSLQVNVPRFIVERFLGARELGFFAANAYVIIAGARVVTALGDAAAPRLAARYADRDRRGYAGLVGRMVLVGAAVGAIGVTAALVFGREILALLYRAEYADQAPTFVLLMAAAALGYLAQFLQYALTAARALRIQAVISAASLALTAAGAYAAVGAYGTRGVAAAIALGAAFQACACALATRVAIRRLGE